MANEKIMIIEDDKNISALCRKILLDEGYDVVVVDKGIQGIKKLETEKFSLVLLDIHLPMMNGFEVLEKIRQNDETIPVVMMTGFGTVENAVKAIKIGANDFISKPFVLGEFLEKVEKNLELPLFSKEITKLKMIETILELNRVIITLTSLDELLDKIVSITRNIFEPAHVYVYLSDESGSKFILRKQTASMLTGRRVALSYSCEDVAHVFQSRKVILGKDGESTWLTAPFFGREKNIGFIKMHFTDNGNIREEEVRFLEVFAVQAGIGLENANLFGLVKNSYLNSIRSLINSLEAKDAYTKGHSEQVAYYAFLIGKKMKLDSRKLEILRNASYLHDLGKLGIRDAVLLKPGPLSEDEFKLIREHPCITVKILEPLGLRKEELETCFFHHEKMDGSGYPKGLRDKDIPPLARILSVADAYSAMVSERPYRKSLNKLDAASELKKCAGMQFDRKVVDVFVEILKTQENLEFHGTA